MIHSEWLAEAIKRFGPDRHKWKFKCPSCGHIASAQDWKDAGASEGEIAFSCIGRHTMAGNKNTFAGKGGPCNYAGGGLLRLNPVPVQFDGRTIDVFDFAEVKP